MSELEDQAEEIRQRYGAEIVVPLDAYGPLVLTGKGALRPGDDGFEEAWATAQKYKPPNLKDAQIVGTLPPGAVIHLKADGSGEILVPDQDS